MQHRTHVLEMGGISSGLGIAPVAVFTGVTRPRLNQGRSAGLGRTRLFHPWGREPEGGWVGLRRSVSHVVRSGLMSVTHDA